MKIAIVFLLFSLSSPTFAIKKCKDAEGKWHYGDVAVDQCENSKVTTLNERGFITEEKEAPKTEEELALEAEQNALVEQQEKQRLADEEEKRRVLSIYETESDIDRLRDNQLQSVEGNIEFHKAYLKNMGTRIARSEDKLAETKGATDKQKIATELEQAKSRVAEFEHELASLQQQKIDISDRFAREKELYLLLKGGNKQN